MELKLTNVARASLEELRLDYEDFLRQRALPLWPRTDARRADLIRRRPTTADAVAEWAREVHQGAGDQERGRDGQSGRGGLDPPSTRSTASTRSTYPEIAANAALALIAVATALLDRQITAQAQAFEQEGGFTERLYRVRSANKTQRPA